MPHNKRARFVPLIALVRRRFPDIPTPEELVRAGLVLVDGAPASNPKAFVRSNAAVKVLHPKPLRGTAKLAHAIAAFGLELSGVVALDLGAAAGGFTQALLDAGAARVYAVDVGVGPLRGSLRADPRVVNLERTNLAALDRHVVPEPVDVVVMDLSYLSITGALGQLGGLRLAPNALMVTLVKPTFELHSATLADRPEQVAAAVAIARESLLAEGWELAGQVSSPVTGSRGAVEELLLAKRRSTA